MSSGFGNWTYENPNNPSSSSSSDSNNGADGGMTLPLFQNANIPSDLGWGNIKSAMEAQMPQKVLGMNYQERFRMFCALLLLSGVLFSLAFFIGLPMISIRPQKFALSFTCGSFIFMGSFAILRGPYPHIMGMLDTDRLPFTTVYIGSMLATLYFTFRAHGPKGYIMVLTWSAIQLMALLWYLITFLPGGAQGLSILMATLGKILKPIIYQCAKLNAIIVAKCFSWCITNRS